MGSNKRSHKKTPEIQDMIKIRKENMAKYYFSIPPPGKRWLRDEF